MVHLWFRRIQFTMNGVKGIAVNPLNISSNTVIYIVKQINYALLHETLNMIEDIINTKLSVVIWSRYKVVELMIHSKHCEFQ